LEEERLRKELEGRVYWDVVSRRPASIGGLLTKMLAEPGYAASVIRKNLSFGKPRPLPLLTTDRLVLERQIFTYYESDQNIRDVLFIGCDADTARYERFFDQTRFVTVEPDPNNRDFGATEHIVDSMENLDAYFEPESFDLVICNGVFGWGLDEFDNCQAAFQQAHRVLRDGGQLMVGWNDVPRRTPVALESIPSLSQFEKYDFPVFGTWRYLTDTVYRHTFDFYRKG